MDQLGLSKRLDNRAVRYLEEEVVGMVYFMKLRKRAGAEWLAQDLEEWADA